MFIFIVIFFQGPIEFEECNTSSAVEGELLWHSYLHRNVVDKGVKL